MHRARRLLPVLPLLLALAGCAKSKPKETPAPAPDTSASAATVTASRHTAAPLLCSDGLHRRGDHWKVDCNGCRCGADGDIVCTRFPCADDAGAPDAAH